MQGLTGVGESDESGIGEEEIRVLICGERGG